MKRDLEGHRFADQRSVKVAVTWSGVCCLLRQLDLFAVKDYINDCMMSQTQKAQQVFEMLVSKPAESNLPRSSMQHLAAFPDDGELHSTSRCRRRPRTGSVDNCRDRRRRSSSVTDGL